VLHTDARVRVSSNPITTTARENDVGKEHRSKKETKKKPAANLSEKRAAKKAKKEQRNSSGL
jgi:hypothetical protein